MTVFKQTPLKPGFNVQFDGWYNTNGAPGSAYPLDVAAQVANARGAQIIRNQFAFHLTRGFWGWWDNNMFDCQLVRRATQADTLEFICGSLWNTGANQKNTYVPVANEPIVLALENGTDGWFHETATLSILGQNVALKSKLLVLSSEQRAANVSSAYPVERNVHDVIRVRFPGVTFNNAAQDMAANNLRVIHWNFFKQGSGASAVWRWQCAAAADMGVFFATNGGRYFHGGNQGQPTWRDNAAEFDTFGDTLGAELFTGYLDGLAQKFASLNPENVLIGYDNEATRDWPRLKQLLNDFVYPQMRQRFPNHTLAFQGPGWNNPYAAYTEWTDWQPPGNDRNWLMEFHYYPAQVRPPDGSGPLWILTQSEANIIAQMCRDTAVRQNAGGYIVGEHGIYKSGTVDPSWGPAANDTERTTRTNYGVRAHARYGATTVLWQVRWGYANTYGEAVSLGPSSQIHQVYSQYAGIYDVSGVSVEAWPLTVEPPPDPTPGARTPRLLRGRSGTRLLRGKLGRLLRG